MAPLRRPVAGRVCQTGDLDDGSHRPQGLDRCFTTCNPSPGEWGSQSTIPAIPPNPLRRHTGNCKLAQPLGAGQVEAAGLQRLWQLGEVGPRQVHASNPGSAPKVGMKPPVQETVAMVK